MSIVIGVDVSKFFSTYTFINSKGTVIHQPFNADNDLSGLSFVLEEINKVTSDSNDPPIIIMESTGYFSNRLRDFFYSHKMQVMEINPLVSNSIRNVAIRKVKNDKSDSIDLANLLMTSQYNQSLAAKLRLYEYKDERYTNLRVLTRARSKLAKDRSSVRIRLISDLEQVLPYFNKVFRDPSCKSSLALLSILDDSLSIDKNVVINTLKNTTPNRGKDYFEATFSRLLSCLNDASVIGRKVPSFFFTIKIHVALIIKYDEELRRVEKEIDKISSTLENVRLLKTIPGISDTIASCLASEIGNITKFKNAKSLVAFCGIDPSVKQSGQYNKLHNNISKRGAPRLRSALYMAALLSVARYKNGEYANKVIYDYYHLKKQSKPGNVALGAVMHKLVRIIFSVLKNQKDFVMITPEQQQKLYKNNLKMIA